jgi:hypothetical protein
MMIRYFLLTLLAIVFLSGGGCHSSTKNDPSKYSDSLIVVKGAKDIHYSKLEGTDQLFYSVKVPYPAPHVLNEISKKLEIKGWKPLKEDYLNPGSPSSHVKGWTDSFHVGKKTKRKFHQWLAQWENKNQDIMCVTLWYSYLEGDQVGQKNLSVSMIFIPSELAKEVKEYTLDYSSQNKDK